MTEQEQPIKLTTFPSRLYAGRERQNMTEGVLELEVNLDRELEALLEQGIRERLAERKEQAQLKAEKKEPVRSVALVEEKKSEENKEDADKDFDRGKGTITVLGQTADERAEILKEVPEDKYQHGLIEGWNAIRDVASSYLQSWDKTRLREAWVNWSEYNPQQMSSEFAKAREEVRQCLTKIAQDKGFFTYLTTGEEYEVQSPLQLASVDAAEVKIENQKLGEKYGEYIQLHNQMHDPLDLVMAFKEWKTLQETLKLPTTYNARDVDTYSASTKAVFKVLKALENKLAKQGITDVTDTEQIKMAVRHAAEEQSSQERAKKSRDTYSGQHRTEEPSLPHRSYQEESNLSQKRETDLERRNKRPKQEAPSASSVDWAAIDAEIARSRRESQQMQQQQERAYQQRETARPKKTFSSEMERLSQAIDDAELASNIASSKVPDFLARADSINGEESHLDNIPQSTEGLPKYEDMINQVQSQNWDNFAGWSESLREEQKQNIMRELRLTNPDDADRILAALLVRGQTATEVAQNMIAQDRVWFNYLDGLNIFKTDEEAFEIAVPSAARRDELLKRDFQDSPRNIEDLAWQMSFQEGHHFSQSGPYPLFSRGVKETEVDGKKKFHFVEEVNPENMIMWIRAVQMELHGLKPDGSIDFTHEVSLKKDYSPVNIHRMLENKDIMFKSKNGRMYNELAGAFEREAMFFQITREFRISYIQNYGDEKKLQEARLQQFYLNLLTKPLYGKSFFYWLHMMPEAYKKNHESDSKMGASINTMFMAYNYLTNPAELARVLQVNSLDELFHKKKLEEVRNAMADESGTNHKVFCDLDKFKGFNPDGSLNMKNGGAAVIEMLNFYTQNTPDESFKKIIRTIIKDRAADLHGLVDTKKGEDVSINKNIAELMAYDMSWFMGVATINDVNNAGFNAEVRAGDAYRLKQATERGGKWGNLWTIGQFKRWLIMPMHAIRTTVPGGEHPLMEKDGTVKEVRNPKSIFEGMNEISTMRVSIDARLTRAVEEAIHAEANQRLIEKKMHDLWHAHEHHHDQDWLTKYKNKNSEDLRKIATKEIKSELRDKIWDKWNKSGDLKDYKDKADQFIFKENASRDYYLNHYVRGFQLDERLRGGKDIRFDKFITHDPILGAVFRQEDYQQEMSGLITAARYTFQTYGELNYDSLVWAWNPNLYGPKVGGMEEVPLGKSMFGFQLANIPELTTNGIIDWTKVNSPDGKKVLFKRWVEVFITGQILQYRAITRWQTHPRYSYALLEDILEGISKIPKGLEFDETDMRNVDVKKDFFFDKDAIKRIRKQSGTGALKVALTEMFVRGLFGKGKDEGLFSGLGMSFGIFLSAVLKV